MTRTEELLALARECGAIGDFAVCFTPNELTRFYAKAQAQALRDAAMSIHPAKALTQQDLIRMAEELEKKT